MSVGPTSRQQERRQRAQVAKQVLSTDEFRSILKLAEDRALRALRVANTPEEAWQARALLMGHDEIVGVLKLIALDDKNVEREISQAEATNAGAATQARQAEDRLEYLRKAQAAREKLQKMVHRDEAS